MRRLNKARVNLKHFGIMPSTADVQELRDASTSFLQEATSQVFQISFTELSLIDLVTDQRVAGYLREASDALANTSSVEPALDALAKAFHCFRKYLGDQVVRIPGRPPVWIQRISRPRTERGDRETSLPRFSQYVDASIEELRSRMSMLELGVDMSRFRRFSAFVPRVLETADGKLHVRRGPGYPALEATQEEALECFDFLLDTAVRLANHMESIADENSASSGGA
jgi:hypothetical protein